MKNDLISRQMAIDAVHEEFDDCLVWDESGKRTADEFEIIINRLPSAQPKAIRPKFVADDKYIKNYFQIFPHCPKCNYELETGDCYCRVCGCRIDWSEDDE